MKKALIVASVASMIDQFNMPFIQLLNELGYEVHIACNFEQGNTCDDKKIVQLKQKLFQLGAKSHQIDFDRNVLNLVALRTAMRQMTELLEQEKFALIHCHSPVGGLVTRIVDRKARKQGTKVIYTAHGFHFYKGAAIKNWLCYYPVEWLCSFFTDVLITINLEDYRLARRTMKAKKTVYVPGVGIELNRFKTCPEMRREIREELKIPDDAVVLLSVGELNENKNHKVVLEAIKDLDVFYLIVGQGKRKELLEKECADLNLTDRVKLLGFRSDIQKIYSCADIFVFPSYREGLPVSLMEAMASGLPCVVSRIRGNTDLIEEGKGGMLFEPNRSEALKDALRAVLEQDRTVLGTANQEKMRQFSLETVLTQMQKIYLNQLQ